MASIKTYARIKPSDNYLNDFDVSDRVLSFKVPEVLREYGNSPGKSQSWIKYDFMFHHIFNISSTQEDIYENVAKEIVEGFLNGYNGTIFAFGQTGSGKTFTMEGGSYSYKDRGIAPRVLSTIYKSLEGRECDNVVVEISYLEIYQEVGYDLLNAAALNTFSPVVPLSKISVVEGGEGCFLTRNLSLHLAANEEVAQCLLLQGQCNRKVAETPVNQRSSRSHGVFTIYLTCKAKDSDIIVKSKLHLVDLAGSERVSKTGVDGLQLLEAKSINLSLHYLESVILALHADAIDPKTRKRKSNSLLIPTKSFSSDTVSSRHIPYRNSLLTMLLRDSLGGNCLTAMIATISLEPRNLGESISTCRFAQRVACISNHVTRNEELDEKATIKKLQKRVTELETELSCLKLEHTSEEESKTMASKLTDEDKILCSDIVKNFLDGRIKDPVLSGINTPYRFRECFKLLKEMIIHQNTNIPSSNVKSAVTGADVDNYIKNNINIHVTTKNFKQIDEKKTGKRRARDDEQENERTQTSQHSYSLTERKNIQNELKVIKQITKQREENNSDSMNNKTQNNIYKSPFECRREKEIEKLTKSIASIEEKKKKNEKEIKVMKRELSQKQMVIDSLQLSKELEVVKKQIENQHNYIGHLNNIETDDYTIQQEMLVEKQLKRKESKILEKLKILKDDGEKLIVEELEKEKEAEVKVEERFGKYRKRDGSLNTRQVFDMLKQEENKTRKAALHIEKEKMETLSKQLALKELETRQKLKDLKEILKQSKLQGVSVNKDVPVIGSDLTITEYTSPISEVSVSLPYHESDEQFKDKNIQSNEHQKYDQNVHVDDKSKTVTPSLYVNRVETSADVYANKMGVSSVSFDAALSAMLDRDVVASSHSYNKYAYSGGKKNKKKRQISQIHNNMDDATKMVLNWGESSKHVPVSEKLDRLFEKVEKDHFPVSARSGQGFSDHMSETSTKPFSRLSHPTNNRTSPTLLNVTSPNQNTISALSEERSEKSYLSKAQMEKNRINRIRKAQSAASIIQFAWKQYKNTKSNL